MPAKEEEEELTTAQQNHELFLVSNLGASGTAVQLTTDSDRAKYAQSFSAPGAGVFPSSHERLALSKGNYIFSAP